MRVRFYVDGLNFYYGVAKAINFKWIDLERCLRQAVEKQLHTVITTEQIQFFASAVSGDAKSRQAVYYNALRAHSPNIKIRLGRIEERNKKGELTRNCRHCGQGQGDIVPIRIREEKQTDVNIATAMVQDAYAAHEKFDVACLVSNDSDLSSPVTIRTELGQRTILLTPLVRGYDRHTRTAGRLKREILNPDRDWIKHLAEDDVRQCALPSAVAKFTIPGEWVVG